MDDCLKKHAGPKSFVSALVDANYDKKPGEATGSLAPFAAIAHLYVNSMEEFGASFGSSVPVFMADKPNYTDNEPVVQVNEVIGLTKRTSQNEPTPSNDY